MNDSNSKIIQCFCNNQIICKSYIIETLQDTKSPHQIFSSNINISCVPYSLKCQKCLNIFQKIFFLTFKNNYFPFYFFPIHNIEYNICTKCNFNNKICISLFSTNNIHDNSKYVNSLYCKQCKQNIYQYLKIDHIEHHLPIHHPNIEINAWIIQFFKLTKIDLNEHYDYYIYLKILKMYDISNNSKLAMEIKNILSYDICGNNDPIFTFLDNLIFNFNWIF